MTLQSRDPSSPRRARRAFTLVELMVAMSLGIILMGATVFIFTQSQKIFVEMDAKVTVYQYARTAFDQIERDLANSVKTHDMEFFQDRPATGLVGHYDFAPGDPEAVPVMDRGQTAHRLAGNEQYVYAMALHQPPEYRDNIQNKNHRCDSLYFRTVTTVDGRTRPVLVEYALDYKRKNGTLRRLPRLVRRTWSVSKVDNTGLGGAPQILLNQNTDPLIGDNEPFESELCLYVTDVSFEFYMINKRSGRPGRFMSAKDIVRAATIDNDPNQIYRKLAMPNQARGNGFRIACFYDERQGTAGGGGGNDMGEYYQQTGTMNTQSGFGFPMLQPGDTITVFNASDKNFKDRDLTIKSIDPLSKANPDRFGVKFNEQLPPLANPSQPARFRYRAGWLPPMVRMTIKIKDQKAKAVRTLVRQFKILGA